VSGAPEPEPGVLVHVAALIELLFDAPSSPAGWQRFLAAVCEEMSGETVALLIGDLGEAGPFWTVAHGLDTGGLAVERFPILGGHPGEAQMPTGGVVPLPFGDRLARSDLYHRLLAPAGIPPGPGLLVILGRTPAAISAALLVLGRAPGWQPSARDREIVELLSPYVLRAIRTGMRLHASRAEVEGLLQLLDALALGVLLLDDRSRVTFANRSAAELLDTTPGPLRLEATPSLADREQRTQALRRRFRTEAITSTSGAALGDDDVSPLQVITAPLEWEEGDTELAARFAQVMFLGDPGSSRDSAGALRALYGLTPAEARLAQLLADGLSITEAAEQMSIRLSTARGVLKGVFAKTGTRRQASLVGLVLAAAGQIRAPGED
jgi:DNA-binding CsgD family transcriptional regulator/PAS domain-containing protein